MLRTNLRVAYPILLFLAPILAVSWSRLALSSDQPLFLSAGDWKISIFALWVLITLGLFIDYPRVVESSTIWPAVTLIASAYGLWILAFRDALISGFPISKTSFWIPFVLLLVLIKPPSALDLAKGVKGVVILLWLLLLGDVLSITINEVGRSHTSSSTWLFTQSLFDGTWHPGFLPVGMNLAILGILALCLAFSRNCNVPFVSTVVLGILLVILSGSRSSYLAAIAAIMIICGYWMLRRHDRSSSQRKVGALLAISVLAGVFSLSSMALINTRTNDQTPIASIPGQTTTLFEGSSPSYSMSAPGTTDNAPQIGYPAYSDAVTSTLSGRNQIWQFHWKQIMSNPWSILGEDSAQILKTLGLANDRPGESSSPMQSAHNMILDHWHRFGLLGLALLSSLILSSLLIVVPAAVKNFDPLGVAFLGAILILGISDVIFSWTELTSGVLLLLWVLCLVRTPRDQSEKLQGKNAHQQNPGRKT